jgi:hypothetical protein
MIDGLVVEIDGVDLKSGDMQRDVAVCVGVLNE